MKSKDIGLIVIIGIISAALSIVLSNLIIPAADQQQEVETVEPISAEFQMPPDDYFNDDALNPTREIEIRQDPDSNPFNGN